MTFWTTDKPVAEEYRLPDNTQRSQETDINVPGWIRTCNPSKRSAADRRLRSHGHWDRHSFALPYDSSDQNDRSFFFLQTIILTYGVHGALFEQLILAQLVQNFSCFFYGTNRLFVLSFMNIGEVRCCRRHENVIESQKFSSYLQ
jgi:hypothetical protein